MPRYEIKKGYENRVFANSRRIATNMLESDQELNSPYLSLVAEVAAPASPQPAAQPQAPNQPSPQPIEQTVNREATQNG